MKQTKKVLIGCTGSVASLKLPIIVQKLVELSSDNIEIEIKVIVTEHAKHFYDINEMPSHIKIYDDAIEWDTYKNRGDPVIHIELGNWADILVIAPLDANSLGKMASGVCDNLLLCTTRAWPMEKPLLFCPAMNTRMWEHPITKDQIKILKKWGHKEIPVVSKKLICGEIGLGAMAEVDTIIQTIKTELKILK